MATVEQELKVLREKHTEREYVEGIRNVVVAMDENRLIGDEFVSGNAGCFYGCFVGFNEPNALQLARSVRAVLAQPVPDFPTINDVTPIERLLRDNASYSPEVEQLKATLLATIQ